MLTFSIDIASDVPERQRALRARLLSRIGRSPQVSIQRQHSILSEDKRHIPVYIQVSCRALVCRLDARAQPLPLIKLYAADRRLIDAEGQRLFPAVGDPQIDPLKLNGISGDGMVFCESLKESTGAVDALKT